MTMEWIGNLTLLAPGILLAVAATAPLRPPGRPGPFPPLAEAAALGALGLALAGGLRTVLDGPADVALPAPLQAVVLRADPLSATMSVLVAAIGWVVIRYSRTYLRGAARESGFHGLMLATLAFVLVLVQSGSLPVLAASFIAVGAGLRQLLLFFPDRPEARRAAAKFTIVWGLGDAALIVASLLLWNAFGVMTVSELMTASAAPLPPGAQLAVALLAASALAKSAALPLHGWITEVMEAPTPVSALLHAGVINAGGFLLIRLADLVQASPGAMASLVMLGGLSALVGALVMLTQSAVKTALAWSTVSQMGFMLLQCGLGLWPLALLHIVAHSLYKAHAFLSAGGAIEAVSQIRRPGPVATPGPSAVARAFILAVVLYAGVAALFGLFVMPKSAQALSLGAILIFGVSYLVAQGLADAAPRALTRRTALASLGAAIAYFSFHAVAGVLWGPSLPPPPAPTPLEWGLIVLALSSFGAVAIAQALLPHWAHHPASAGLRVHFANGFYLNALLDRAIRGFRTGRPL